MRTYHGIDKRKVYLLITRDDCLGRLEALQPQTLVPIVSCRAGMHSGRGSLKFGRVPHCLDSRQHMRRVWRELLWWQKPFRLLKRPISPKTNTYFGHSGRFECRQRLGTRLGTGIGLPRGGGMLAHQPMCSGRLGSADWERYSLNCRCRSTAAGRECMHSGRVRSNSGVSHWV